MIPVPSGVRVWLAVGRTDMRKGMNGLALQVQQGLGRDPRAGDLYVFRGARGPLSAHLLREREIIPAPSSCPCCGGKLAKLGEDIVETLEVVPRQWKVIQTVREKFTCRCCEKITQPPAPFHAIARARAGASLLAMILYAKFGQHQPLNRQSDVYAREGIELDVSTLADWVGACSATLAPLVELIRRQVLAADRIHGDDTTVPVLARTKTVTGRLWTYVRDDRPFDGSDPPAAMFFYSRDRGGEHPRRHLSGWAGTLQADAYAGFGELYEARRSPQPIAEAACWAHGRRKFFVLADLKQAPLATEAVRRIDEIFAIEREINGGAPAACRPTGTDQAAGRRTGKLDAHRTRPAVAPRGHRQGHGLYAEALACLHAVSR
jgi:transposase